MSSSQFTFLFFRGVQTTNQVIIIAILGPFSDNVISFKRPPQLADRSQSCEADSAWPVWDSATFSVGAFQM